MARIRRKLAKKSRTTPAALVANVDKRARFSEDIKQRAVAMAREGKVTREIGTALGLDKSQWQNIRLWTEKANVDLPKERVRVPRRGKAGPKATTPAARKVRAVVEPADPLARILNLIENPEESITALEAEKSKLVQRLSTIDKLLAILRTGD